jgi:translation initiation factor IF-2
MNVTELARILRVTPQELLAILPRVGFDVGQRAIKIDNKTAQKIIREWPLIQRQLEAIRKKEEEKEKEEIKKSGAKKTIIIPNFITVREFAALAGITVSKILSELMKNSIFASLNEKIDFDTAAIIGADLGIEVKLENKEEAKMEIEENKLKTALNKEKELFPRPPVIVVMGHVDHGKTTLLDAIRKTNVVAGEAGGITQHIGAYQVIRKNKLITFIDTPGHEAFTAMRSRGAKVADVAILVVAADDGIKPQTIEAYNIIKAAKVPFVVAINKIDKEGASPEKAKQELSSQLGVMSEDWGGKTIMVPVSAKKEIGIEDLLDMVLLAADMEAENIKANPEAKAIGTVIESRISRGEGPVATILIQNGTLRLGDQLVFNNQIYGKVRLLKNYKGEVISEAAPSAPVKIIGLKLAPTVGDILEVGEGEKINIRNLKAGQKKETAVSPAKEEGDDSNIKKINLIIKSDFLGSAEAIEESLEKINTEEVKVKIIRKGLGNITDGDIGRAEATNAQIIGFNIKLPPPIAELARGKNIIIKNYNIIYDLINDIRAQMQELTEPELKRVDLGRLKVLAVFRTENKKQVVGGKVLEGKIEKDSNIEVIRAKDIIAEGKLARLQSGKQDVNSVEISQECGIEYEGRPLIEAGDILNFYKEEKIIKKI